MTSNVRRSIRFSTALCSLALLFTRPTLAQQAAPSAPPPAAPPPAAALPPPPAPAPLPPPIAITFTADDPNAALEMQLVGAPGERSWGRLCFAPCQRQVDPRPAYRIAGPSVLPSDPFYLPQKPQVALDAEVETKGGRAGWAVLTIGGGGLALIGTIVFMTGAVIEAAEDELDDDDTDGGSVMLVGGVMLGGGIAMGVVGLVNLVGGESTVRVTNRDGKPSVALGEGLELRPEGLAF